VSIQRRISPDSRLRAVADRATMLAAAARLGDRTEADSAAALSRALRATATGRFTAAERDWIERVERRRRRIASVERGRPSDELRTACPYWSIPRVWGRFLHRLVRELAPVSCLELGVGVGVSAAYQAAALELNGRGELLALDREESLAEVARQGFSELGLDRRVTLRMGPIGETLGPAAADAAPVDYAYIDAEHTEEATVENFERLLPHLREGAVVVVDDIRADPGMERAWARIGGNQGAALALGLRRVGVVVAGRTSTG
jgi:predicted O-methyltransferase YrrM